MNKLEFLDELEKRIRVLEKNEIKDILSEYSQHIDMRIESGLSEAEAIKDFGSIDELIAEILEAYHVNPEYESEKEHTDECETENIHNKKRIGSLKVKAYFIVVWIWIKNIFSNIFDGFKNILKRILDMVKKIFVYLKKTNSKADYTCNSKILEPKSKLKQTKDKNNNLHNKVKEGFKGVIKKLIYAFLVLIIVICLVPVSVVGIASIFAVGVSITLLIQGYPVLGIFITLIGLSVCCITLGGLMISLVTRDKKDKFEKFEINDGFGEAITNE